MSMFKSGYAFFPMVKPLTIHTQCMCGHSYFYRLPQGRWSEGGLSCSSLREPLGEVWSCGSLQESRDCCCSFSRGGLAVSLQYRHYRTSLVALTMSCQKKRHGGLFIDSIIYTQNSFIQPLPSRVPPIHKHVHKITMLNQKKTKTKYLTPLYQKESLKAHKCYIKNNIKFTTFITYCL